ncbi:RNA-binding protein 12 [Fasciola hepatica]|uniref:RNA-binding protein 12 n=1 Tax=Fasciola hepatica TaxID=6192 RepID=A0A4E0QUB7_FASHE|nr:RNA-binding protein 12 [Fasciola hepatica]
MSANASNIRRFFVGLAIPEGGVHIVGGNDGDAFIAFATDEDARKAMLLDRQTINGAPVRLFLSSKTEMQSVIESARSSALYTGVTVAVTTTAVPQKTEAMQALDVTAPTLPSSFPSYRNGAIRDSYPEVRSDQFAYPGKRPSPPPHRSFEAPVSNPYPGSSLVIPPRLPDGSAVQEPLPPNREYDFSHQPNAPFSRYDGVRDRISGITDYPPPRDHSGSSDPPPDSYRSYYDDSVYDRHATDGRFAHSKDSSRDDPRGAYSDARYNRNTPDNRFDYNKPLTPPGPPPDRIARDGFSREPEIDSDPSSYPSYPPPDRHRPPPPYDRQQPPFPNSRGHGERDFSVRPPWLNEDAVPHGSKRPFHSQQDLDDYGARKRRIPPPAPPPPVKSASEASPLETEFVVRLAVPVTEVGVKSVFEILRGVHIVPKWGIRIEEDALQRPTGYIYIMVTARESFDRALSYDGRPYRGKTVKVTQSSLDEFYCVTDSNFRSKCPPEIIKKLPSPGEPFTPPYHADGCLEVAELPPDATRSEVVRFLGAPGLSPSDVVIASFAPSDRTAPLSPKSVRALVVLPSAKDMQILLSAKARPLRPDGAFPPVRLTSISRLQFEAFSVYSVDGKPVTDSAKAEKSSANNSAETTKSHEGESLTCAFLSGLSRYLKDSEVLRLFPSILIPGDAIRMVPPANTSAYIDFISENNCRRAMSDVTGKDSNAKLSHPDIRLEPISREDMESRLENIPKPEEPHITERNSRPPVRDPRDTRNWDPRTGPRPPHVSPVAFRSRSPPPGKPGYSDSYYDRNAPPVPFEDVPVDAYVGSNRRRPPMDMPPHPGPPPNDYHQPRPVDHQALPPPIRRVVPDFVTVFIGNLPPSVTVDQLAGIIRDYYFVPGSVRIRRDVHGVPTGEALVDFNSSYDADRVIRDLSGYRIAGRPIVLQYDLLYLDIQQSIFYIWRAFPQSCFVACACNRFTINREKAR